MGCTRSPSGCKEEKLAGVCAEAVAADGMGSVAAEAAAVEKRKLRREISCVAGFLSKLIGKEGWLFHASAVKNLDLCKRRSRVSQPAIQKIAYSATVARKSARWYCSILLAPRRALCRETPCGDRNAACEPFQPH